MTGTIRATANDILDRVAAECGLDAVADPWASNNQEYRQLRYLLNIAGEELTELYDWDFLRKEHSITTVNPGDTGEYDLPTDFLRMIDQTGWERAENTSLRGPLSAQDWAYLKGRNLVSGTIYASFRLMEDKFHIFPQPPPDGLEIYFEYIARNWVEDSQTADNYISQIATGSDTPLFNRTLISRYLKVKFLEAKGFDSSKAQADLNQIFALQTGANKSAKVLNAGRPHNGPVYLDRYSVPDTGYGS